MLPIGRGWSLGLSRWTALAINEAAELATSGRNRVLTVEELAERTGAGMEETQDVLARLGEAGLVECDGGDSEAYRLRREADQVSLFEIASAVREPFHVCQLDGDGAADPEDASDELLATVFQSVNAEVVSLFKARKLSDVLVALG